MGRAPGSRQCASLSRTDPAFAAPPHPSGFADTRQIAQALPQTPNPRAIFDAMLTDINVMWLNGTGSAMLVMELQSSVDRILRRNR